MSIYLFEVSFRSSSLDYSMHVVVLQFMIFSET